MFGIIKMAKIRFIRDSKMGVFDKIKKGISGFFDIGRNEYYQKLKIDGFVEVVEKKFRLKNADIIENKIGTLMKTTEHKVQPM